MTSNLIQRNRTGVCVNHWRSNGQIAARILARNLVAIAVIFLSCISSKAQSLGVFGNDFAEATVSFQTIVTPAASAAFSNYVTRPAGFGGGADGLGYHYGVSLADNVNGKFMRKFLFAALSRQREQYHPLGSGHPIFKRIANVAMHSLFADPETSSKTFNWSGIPASFAAAGLSNAYQPNEQRRWSATFARFGTTSASYMGGDLWLEFTEKARQNRVFRAFLKTR